MEKMKDNFTKSKYFKHMLDNADLMKAQWTEFNKKILSLISNQTDELGIVLKCHLIIDHYIDEYLEAAYPTIQSWDKARLTFRDC